MYKDTLFQRYRSVVRNKYLMNCTCSTSQNPAYLSLFIIIIFIIKRSTRSIIEIQAGVYMTHLHDDSGNIAERKLKTSYRHVSLKYFL